MASESQAVSQPPGLDKSKPLTRAVVEDYIHQVDNYLGLQPIIRYYKSNRENDNTLTERKGVWIEGEKNPTAPIEKLEQRYRMLDFSHATFQEGEDFSGLDFGWSNFSHALAHDCNFSNCNFGFANLDNADFSGGKLRGSYLSYHCMRNADLRDTDATDIEINQMVDVPYYHEHPELPWPERRGSSGFKEVKLNANTRFGCAYLPGLFGENTDFTDVDLHEAIGLSEYNFSAAKILSPELMPLYISIDELAEERKEYDRAHPETIQLTWENDDTFIQALEARRKQMRENDWKFEFIDPNHSSSGNWVDKTGNGSSPRRQGNAADR